MNLSQDGIKLHRGNFTAIGRQIQPYLEEGKCFRMVLKPWREKRSLSQNALSHMWYSEISEYLISRGKTFATPAWVKDALKHTYLGYETKDLVDVVTGEITTIQSLRHTSDLDSGEMYVFLCKVEAWAVNIGCHLTIRRAASSSCSATSRRRNGYTAYSCHERTHLQSIKSS